MDETATAKLWPLVGILAEAWPLALKNGAVESLVLSRFGGKAFPFCPCNCGSMSNGAGIFGGLNNGMYVVPVPELIKGLFAGTGWTAVEASTISCWRSAMMVSAAPWAKRATLV